VTWFDLFSAQHCPACFLKIKQPGHGLRRSTCEKCHATLPDAIALHLDRAMRGRWYMQWFQVAMRILRRNEALENRPNHSLGSPVATDSRSALRGNQEDTL
jgi:hypothetical protein